MDFEKEKQTETQTQTEQEQTKETKLSGFSRFDDFIKSEEIVSPSIKVDGLTEINDKFSLESKTFKKKEDKTEIKTQNRLKVVSSVYITIVSLLLVFVASNAITLAIMNRKIDSNKEIINKDTIQVVADENSKQADNNLTEGFTISLNEPRDYSDDTKELTFFDKISIIFRNIFG